MQESGPAEKGIAIQIKLGGALEWIEQAGTGSAPQWVEQAGKGAAENCEPLNFDPERAPAGLSILTLKVFKLRLSGGTLGAKSESRPNHRCPLPSLFDPLRCTARPSLFNPLRRPSRLVLFFTGL